MDNNEDKKTVKEIVNKKKQDLQEKRKKVIKDGVKRPTIDTSKVKMLENYVLETMFKNITNFKENILSDKYGISQSVLNNIINNISNSRDLKNAVSKVVANSITLNRVGVLDRKGKNIRGIQKMVNKSIKKNQAMIDRINNNKKRTKKNIRLPHNMIKNDDNTREDRNKKVLANRIINERKTMSGRKTRVPLKGRVIRTNKKNRINENNGQPINKKNKE